MAVKFERTLARRVVRATKAVENMPVDVTGSLVAPSLVEQKPLKFQNTGNQIIPAYGVCMVDRAGEFNNAPYLKCIEVDTDTPEKELVFNGHRDVNPGDLGNLQSSKHGWVKALYSGNPPSVSGAQLGVSTGAFTLNLDFDDKKFKAGGVINTNDKTCYAIKLPAGSGAAVFLDLDENGGNQANALNKATWVYNVTDAITGDTLGSNVDPTAPPHRYVRWHVQMEPATSGIGFYLNDQLVIQYINEEPLTEVRS